MHRPGAPHGARARCVAQACPVFAVDSERLRTGEKRGRPSLGLSPEEKKARTNAQAAKRMKAKRAKSKNPLRKNSHGSSYITTMERDEFSVTLFQCPSAEGLKPDGAAMDQRFPAPAPCSLVLRATLPNHSAQL